MFLIETEKDLLQSFRPRDREKVEVPKGLKFPLFVRDYFAWVEPAGTRVFLVCPSPDKTRPMGLAFRRDSQGSSMPSQMCDWCHTYGSSNEIGLLSTDVNSKRRVGVNLCLDLRCKEKLESAADLSGRYTRDLLPPLMERMRRFATEALRIHSVPES
ncbi:FBP domain-containing protein [Melittangium boletus]|uniref:FBP domain-containing protein n=1 Tax=Melittangium boletus TaxID=83453 RepID=UPI003DA47D0B